MQLDLPHPRNGDMNLICNGTYTGNAINFLAFVDQVSGLNLMAQKVNGHLKMGGREPNRTFILQIGRSWTIMKFF